MCLFAFLMGLSEVNNHAHSKILMISLLPSVNKEYAMIIANESQRITSRSHVNRDIPEVAALFASRSNFRHSYTEGKENFGRSQNTYGKKRVNWSLYCDHCKMHIHTREICYKLVGYPEDRKFKRKSRQKTNQGFSNFARGIASFEGKGIANNVQVEREDDELKNDDAFGHFNTGTRHPTQGLHNTKPLYDVNFVHTNLQALAMQLTYSPNQYQKILKILNEEDKADEVVNMAGTFKDPMYTCHCNHIGIMNASDKSIKKESWIVDSGATSHMTSKIGVLDEVTNSNKSVGRKVYLPNGQTTLITHIGNCLIPSGGMLKNVLVVSDFKYNLLSVS